MAKALKRKAARTVKKAHTRNNTPVAESEPKFPYSTKPSSLRKLLQLVPKKPRPNKFDKALLRSWGFTDANDYSILRVLKAVDLLNEKNQPTERYLQFMNITTGGTAIASEIRRVYAPLFEAAFSPYSESAETLKNLFNIHSGGGTKTLEHQIQTFKALCENAVFEANANPSVSAGAELKVGTVPIQAAIGTSVAIAPAVHINVHIHLPENKSRRDYEAIIEDIGRYIFGRDLEVRHE
jgi:hypothetical protein